MNTYIIEYAPLNSYGDIIMPFKTAKVLSESEDIDFIKSEFEKRCDLANENIMNYEGMHILVWTLEEYLKNLPADIF